MSATGVRLGRFRWWHIDEVLSIEADLFGPEQWSAGMFWGELANGHHYLVAVDDDGLLGYAGLAVAPPDEAWVQNIAVRRRAQRRGVGRLLLEALLAEAARRDARSTLLEVAADNAPAQRLYARYGFEPIGVRRGYYQPSNTDALVMQRVATPTGEGTDGHG
ncbi:ribosomal protein S18-alanine N-acetyltransferase [Micromonospora yangpuensis]|uniref:[SSU ribosomal protein S18P]-alanine acetyltransferase n=1 Tax=Micromonospora yangpuensis TaxID=683228 RepID=A0A1C6VA24_9ACTN|nr:ribosomal protein S18-alanine N-acetyltransferase [Micromonospora yangpuensis]GGM22533.1 ribosomal-protein-alanine acetyltransferase [Micromonospora yangpuensis]SCL63136.1 [SSU ribosomal protein S18P]-alanine acetyltransferase [Micromonospora yangpuensis]